MISTRLRLLIMCIRLKHTRCHKRTPIHRMFGSGINFLTANLDFAKMDREIKLLSLADGLPETGSAPDCLRLITQVSRVASSVLRYMVRRIFHARRSNAI